MTALGELYELCKKHFNEPMICSNQVVRCIGYGEDDADCYLITKDLFGKIKKWSMVGGYVWLDILGQQGIVVSHSGEVWNDLYRLDHFLSLNGCEKEDKFLIEIENETNR